MRADDMADIAREPEACTYILCVVVVKDHAAFCHKQTWRNAMHGQGKFGVY